MNKEQVLAAVFSAGKQAAANLQSEAECLSGTELNASAEHLPAFTAACRKKNMLERRVGFTCISSAGRVVRLLQPYDSSIYTQEPEELPAQWGFKWSTDPAKALPFIAVSTSPYNTSECCSEDGVTYRSLIDNNVYAPSAYPQGWEAVSE